MEKEHKHPKLRRKLIGIYNNSLSKRESTYHQLVCFTIGMYAGFVDDEYSMRRLPLALTCVSLEIIEHWLEWVSRIPRKMRLWLSERYS